MLFNFIVASGTTKYQILGINFELRNCTFYDIVILELIRERSRK